MTRRRLAAWSIALPLMVAGSQFAHVFAYRLVYPQTELRLRELVASGHGYMGHAPLFLALFAVIELIAVVTVVAGSVRGRPATPVPAWAFGLLPPLGFAVQEFLERWLAGASFPWWMVLQPTFRVGLLFQIPFGLAAYLVARLLLRVADEVGRSLARERPLPIVGLRAGWSVSPAWLPQIPVLANGHSGRGPPAPAVAAHSTFLP
jgi:hypothetical protein